MERQKTLNETSLNNTTSPEALAFPLHTPFIGQHTTNTSFIALIHMKG